MRFIAARLGLRSDEGIEKFLHLLILGFLLTTPAGAGAQDRPDIRVRLERVKPGAVSFAGIALRFPGSPSSMGFQAIRVSWKRATQGRYAWIVEDRDSGTRLSKFEARTFDINGMSLRIGLKSVPERITLAPQPTGAADVIAKMDLEAYIRGVLPSEMPASWPLEALKAQAVAARTFALFRQAARTKVRASYDVESDVMDQVFRNPMADEGALKETNVDRAIRETRGVILSDARTLPLAAYFHADCGGRTEEANAVWGEGPKSGTAVDGGCPMNPRAQWKEKLTSREIANRLRPKSVLAELVSMQTLSRTESGRIASLKLAWNDGSESVMTGHAFRMAVGFDRVKSTNFKIERTADGEFRFVGQGYGHGVGMCQWGAKRLAVDGKSHREILRHYFPKATLTESERL